MKINLATVLGIVMAGSALTVCAGEHPTAEQPKAPAAEKPAAMAQAVFVCPDCDMMALKAGKCEKCGKDMVEMHMLGTKDGQAMLCQCPAPCKCDAKGMKEGKCGCGKDVKMMSAKGMYVCAMGCPEVSAKPGKCACGMEMKKVE